MLVVEPWQRLIIRARPTQRRSAAVAIAAIVPVIEDGYACQIARQVEVLVTWADDEYSPRPERSHKQSQFKNDVVPRHKDAISARHERVIRC